MRRALLTRLATATLWAATVAACASPSPAPRPSSRPARATAAARAPVVPPKAAAVPPPPSATPPTCDPVRLELPSLIESKIDVPVPELSDPDHAMVPFYERVARLLRGQAKDHVRIALFGDSNMTMDFISGEMRRTLQEKHGDGGHGYVALGRPWSWYRHMDVRSGHERLDWTPFAVSTHPSRDAAYGYAGIAARSERPGAVTWVATAREPSPIGTRASRVDVYYLRKPKAGTFEVRVDGATLARISTDAPERTAGFHALSLPDAPHEIELVAATVEAVTLFGVTLERGSPSFVVDSLGVGAVSGPILLRQDPAVMRAALSHRGYDLVALLLGSNQVWPVKYEAQMAELIARFREALPGVPVLLMTPVDQVASLKSWRSTPDVALVSRQHQRIARDTRAAFWDFRGAMGGDAAMVRFMATGMGHADGIHLTQKGARYMGRRLTFALLRGADRWLAAHPEAGCEPDPRVAVH